MKPSKYTKYFSVECNSFLKSPRQIKGCIVMISHKYTFQIVKNLKIFNVQMEIVCDTQINDHMHDTFLCSKVIFIKHWIY